MALVVKILGGPTVWDATLGAPDANGMITVDGTVYKDQHPVYNEANTALAYSNDPETDFPQPSYTVSLKIPQAHIWESAEY